MAHGANVMAGIAASVYYRSAKRDLEDATTQLDFFINSLDGSAIARSYFRNELYQFLETQPDIHDIREFLDERIPKEW